MIETTVGLICFGLIVLVSFVKLYNLFHKSEKYGFDFILLTQGLLFLLWGIYFVSMLSSVGNETTWLDETGAPIVTASQNNYSVLSIYFELINPLLVLNIFITLAELFFAFPQTLRGRMQVTQITKR